MSDSSLVNAIAFRDSLASRGWRQSGGVALIPATMPPVNATSPRAFTQLLDWEAKQAMACELELQLEERASGSPTAFPENGFSASFLAGAMSGSGATLWDTGGPVLAKYETGGGADARVFYSDVRAGRVSLGVQTRVRVSLARWLRDAPSGLDLAVQGSINPAQALDADPPTYSAARSIAIGATAQITAPPGAMWWDFSVTDAGGGFGAACQVRAAPAQGGTYYRDTTLTAPIQYPPSSPWPWIPGSGPLSFANLSAIAVLVTVTFWVR
jgi:hypothetical protein